MMGDYTEHLISTAGGDGGVSERLDRIQKSNDMWLQSAASDRTDHDIKFLLALVREQAAQIERVRELADEWCELDGITADARYFRQSLGLKLAAALTATDQP